MSGKKKIGMVLIILLLFGAVIGGILWHGNHYVMVDFRFYERNQTYLDLRGQEITVGHYRKLQQRLPGCRIAWDVPLSGGGVDQSSSKITISTLTERDVELLDYLTELQVVQAEGCTDYEQLLALRQRRPEVQVRYSVRLGEERYAQSVTRVDVKNVTAEEITLLASLPELKSVVCSGGEEADVAALQEYCREHGLSFGVNIGGKAVSQSVKNLTVRKATEEELTLLRFLPELEVLRLKEPEASAESLLKLRQARADLKLTWEKEVCGVKIFSEDVEVDLSGAEFDALDQIQEAMAWFPDVETVFLGKQEISNDSLAAYREQVREDYKVVWTVQLGKKLTARTDDTTFMPTRERVYYFNDDEAYNLRYCEDMVCIDIGHMSISKLDFLEFMPDLEFLILAHTQVQYIEPIKYCQKLKFLELDWSPVRDYSPLLECKALEDLNIGNTYADSAPIEKMTWLKNLWMVGCSSGARYRVSQALADTKVMVTGAATVANGWRNLENYYEMRDLLGMYYMTW